MSTSNPIPWLFTRLGAPSYGARKGTVGVVIHTTEGADSTLNAGMATAIWQASAGNTSGGSYHMILTDDGPILTVPIGESAGSISTRRDSIWQPGRYPYLLQGMGAAAYADPNAYLVAISVSGKTAALQSYPKIARIIDDAAQIILWVERQYGINAVVSGHFMWQTDRSDPGLWFFNQVMARYDEIAAAQPPTLPDTTTGGDDLATYVEIHKNNNPLRPVNFAANSKVAIWPGLKPSDMANIVWFTAGADGSSAGSDMLAQVTQDPAGAPSGWYAHLANGVYAGKWVRLADVALADDSTPVADCTAQISAATAPLKTQIDSLNGIVATLKSKIASALKALS